MNYKYLFILALVQYVFVLGAAFLSNRKFNEYKKNLERLYPDMYDKLYGIHGMKDYFLKGFPIKFYLKNDIDDSTLYLLRKKSRFYALVAFLSFQVFAITCFILLLIID